jgi:antitoxin MazE
MEISVISIGNSKGIRLSKTILQKYHIEDKIEITLQEDCIVLRPATSPRKNWDKAFKKMHEQGDDRLLMDDVFEDESFEL